MGDPRTKSSLGIITHQGHISQVNANHHSVSNSVSENITSRASCDAKKAHVHDLLSFTRKTLISEQNQIIWSHSSPSNMETEILTQLKSCQRGVLAKRRYSLTGLWRTPWRPFSLPQEHLKMLASGECYDNCQSHTCHSLQRILTHTSRGTCEIEIVDKRRTGQERPV